MKLNKAADFFQSKNAIEDGDNSSSNDDELVKTVSFKDNEESDENYDEDEDETSRSASFKRSAHNMDDDAEDEDISEDEQVENTNKKLKVLSQEQVELNEAKRKKTGVVYISRVPPLMKPAKMKHILERFGTVNKIFLMPESAEIRARRSKYGGNKKKSYTEGWAEFEKKRHAKLAADTLNNNPIGGKKNNFYHDDILNVKYLHRFKWSDLTDEVIKEIQSRRDKLRAEISQATHDNKAFIDNAEQSKMIKGIQEKRGTKDNIIRRSFNQSKPHAKRSDTSKPVMTDEKMASVLGKIF